VTVTTPTILAPITGDSARARTTDPATSHEAADSISAVALEDSEREVLAIVRTATRPLCAQEIEKAHDVRFWHHETPTLFAMSRIRTAFKQLRDAGVIVPAGRTKTASGRSAQTYVVRLASDRHVRIWLTAARERRLTEVADRGRTRRANHAPLRAA
jgi:hypothetical protein